MCSSSSSSSEGDFLTLCTIAEEEEMRENKKRKSWIHNINIKRNTYGEFHHLHSDLLEDERKFFKYYRMTHEKFSELLSLLRPSIERQNSRFRCSIDVIERLSVCLRQVFNIV